MITANTRCCLQDREVKCSWYSPLWSQKPQTRNLWVIRTRGTVSSPTQRISLQTIWLGQSCTTLNTDISLICFSSKIGISWIWLWLINYSRKKKKSYWMKSSCSCPHLFLRFPDKLQYWWHVVSQVHENLQVVLTLIWRTGDKRCRDVFWPVSLLTEVILVLQ